MAADRDDGFRPATKQDSCCHPVACMGGLHLFQMFASYIAVLAVAMIYYAWRDVYRMRARQRTMLNERVAYMVWVAANRAA